MRMRTAIVGLAALALIAGCGRDDNRGDLTAEENRQLDEAERMLEENAAANTPEAGQ